MNFFRFTLVDFLTALLLFSCTSEARNIGSRYDSKDIVSSTITVDQSGNGNFKTVQEAIDSVSSNNKLWTKIYVKAGIYNEKVSIPQDKPFIVLEGENQQTTVIQFGDAGGAIKSATFTSSAENFVAKNITFKNTYNRASSRLIDGNPITWAPAAVIDGDKSSFHYCSFISLQDTLADSRGRHFFESCYIEGAIDFIWGDGQSIYQGCTLNVTASELGGATGYITAQGRDSDSDDGGFVFKECVVTGTGPSYLGRAYGKYSRVLFYKTQIDNIIVPEGWFSWNNRGFEKVITYAEVNCKGPGSNTSKRVTWEKTLNDKYLQCLINPATFINQEGWLQRATLTLAL